MHFETTLQCSNSTFAYLDTPNIKFHANDWCRQHSSVSNRNLVPDLIFQWLGTRPGTCMRDSQIFQCYGHIVFVQSNHGAETHPSLHLVFTPKCNVKVYLGLGTRVQNFIMVPRYHFSRPLFKNLCASCGRDTSTY